ncbi:hypothetical protein I4U23_018599 [Adineta vaga]|nr:hypothetical protein I4U23_018599 [Adineta vaga]
MSFFRSFTTNNKEETTTIRKTHSRISANIQQWSYYRDLAIQSSHCAISSELASLRYSRLERSLYNLIYTPNDELDQFILYLESCSISSYIQFIFEVNTFEKIIRENTTTDDQQTIALTLFHNQFHIKYQLKILKSSQLQLHDFLYHSEALTYFVKFAEDDKFTDLIQFWIDVEQFYHNISNRELDNSILIENALSIYDQYISMQAPYHLGFDDAIRTKIECSICQPDLNIGPSIDTFDQAVWMIYTILQRVQSKGRLSMGYIDSLGRFIRDPAVDSTDSSPSFSRKIYSKPLQFLTQFVRNEQDTMIREEVAAARFAETFINEITNLLPLLTSCQHVSTLPSYDHVTELNLSNLQLTEIDTFPFEQFPNLHSLNLSNNQLISINLDWTKSSTNTIEYLNLSSNKLETLLFLKDFKYLKTLNITNNLLRNNERFLVLDICPTIEHLIDYNDEQIHTDQMKFNQLLSIIESISYSTKSFPVDYNHFRQTMINQIETYEIYSNFSSSPLGNHFIEKRFNRISSKSKPNFETPLTNDFNLSMNITRDNSKSLFQPMKFLRAHHQSNVELTTMSVYMCAFEPNTSNHILVTCGGCKDSSISCLTWHSNDPYVLVIGSYHTVRFINIRSYIDRVQTFIRKQNKPTVQFDYVDSSMFINKVCTTHIYNLYEGAGPLITITDLLFYPLAIDHTVLLVATTAGLFLIKYQEKQCQSPIQLVLPKSIWIMSEHIVSLRLINHSFRLIAMNILNLDQIYCFNLEQTLENQQIHIHLSFPNPYPQSATKLTIVSKSDKLSECIISSHQGTFYYHSIESNPSISMDQQVKIFTLPNILSATLNEHYLCLTTNTNLICIYKREY